jgi:hypothetical protein
MKPKPIAHPVRLTLAVLVAFLTVALIAVTIRAQEEIFLPIVARPQPTPPDGTIPPTATKTATPAPPTPTFTATPMLTAMPTLTATPTATTPPGAPGSSVRFYGSGRDAIDRITIRIDGPARPADVGATDFTIEFWLRAEADANTGSATCNANDGWITGNVVFDRDIYFAGDYGDFGIALNSGAVAFGLSVGSNGATLCGSRVVTDSQWHHVAVTRRTTGAMALFVDGQPDGSTTGASGDASYRDGRAVGGNPWDPYIVLGAEKHDAGAAYPSFNGWMDELRISNTVRYTAAFSPPAAPFTPDDNTMALYHFDEGTGTTITDVAGATGGPSNGELRVGGSPAGPVWSGERPF